MEKWYARLEKRLREKGWSGAELSRRSGIPKPRIYKYLQGKVKRPPDELDIEAIAKAVGWDAATLMYNVDPAKREKVADPTADEEPSSMRRIPRYDWRDLAMLIAGADGARAAKVKGKMPVPEDEVSDEAFYFAAPDDANAPDIVRGDLLICDPKRPSAPGQYVLALIHGHSEPTLAKYIVSRYHKGVPTDIALVFRDEAHYGRHEAKASEVTIYGTITHRTSRMAPASAPEAIRSR